MDKNNKASISSKKEFDEINFPEDSTDCSNLDFDSQEAEEDTKFLEFLRKMEYPDPPDSMVEKAIQAYARDYAHKILWRKIKIKIQELLNYAGITPGLNPVIVLTGIVLLFVIGVSVYYQYQSANYTKPGLTSNKEAPGINVNPNPAPTTEVTPVITPSIVENNKPINDDKFNINTGNQNNQNNVVANQQKTPSPEETKDLEIEEDKVAVNKIKDLRTRGVKSTPNVTVQESVTLSNLVYVGVSHLNIEGHEIESIDLEIEKELTDAIKSNSKWKLPLEPTNEPQAMFVKQQKDGALVLVNSSRQVLWKDSNYIENYRKDKNYIKSVVISLTENK